MSGFLFQEVIRHKYTSDEAIQRLEEINGCSFSEQQLEVLKSEQGVKIVACAGSGKTFLLVNLVVKRIMTGEIEDTSKLLLTTYSKSGSENMTERINSLLTRAGYGDVRVNVRTLHSLYYQVLKYYGLLRTMITEGERVAFIRQAAKTCQLGLEEDGIQSLNTLFTYQVNNMMSPDALYNSYVFDLELSLEQYKRVLTEFGNLKKAADCMDFDDLQLNIYFYLYRAGNTVMQDYLQETYNYILVDEFQDTSDIQYKILQAMIKDEKNVVFIGDDDQCFVAGTKIKTEFGNRNIEDISIGDRVRVASGHNCTNLGVVVGKKFKKLINTTIYTIKTMQGYEFSCTGEHIVFTLNTNKYQADLDTLEYGLFGSEQCYVGITGKTYYSNLKVNIKGGKSVDVSMDGDKLYADFLKLSSDCCNLDVKRIVSAQLTDENFLYTEVKNLSLGDTLCSYSGTGLYEDEIVSITSERVEDVEVYDLDIAEYHNYLVDGAVVVHNCIYGWRGAKADVLLNADIDYRISKMNLDTNYRCRNTILQFGKELIQHNTRRETKDMKSCKTGGSVNFVYSDSQDLYNMSLRAAEQIKKYIFEDKVKPSDICVLVRYNAHAHILSQLLMLSNVDCIYTKDMMIINQTVFKDIEHLVELCGMGDLGCFDRTACTSVLWKIIKFLGVQNAKLLSDIMQNQGSSFTDALSWVLANVFKVGQYHGNINLGEVLKTRITAYYNKLGSETMNGLIELLDILQASDMNDRLQGLLWLYFENSKFMSKKQNSLRNLKCYSAFFQEQAKSLGYDGFKNLLMTIKIRENVGGIDFGSSVTLTSMHSSKGLEWSKVIILGFDNISLPDADYMVSKEGISTVDMQTYIDGERRLAYVGVTRAVDELTLYTDANNMSVFGLEALGAKFGTTTEAYIEFAKYLTTHSFHVPSGFVVDTNRFASYVATEDSTDGLDAQELAMIEEISNEKTLLDVMDDTDYIYT